MAITASTRPTAARAVRAYPAGRASSAGIVHPVRHHARGGSARGLPGLHLGPDASAGSRTETGMLASRPILDRPCIPMGYRPPSRTALSATVRAKRRRLRLCVWFGIASLLCQVLTPLLHRPALATSMDRIALLSLCHGGAAASAPGTTGQVDGQSGGGQSEGGQSDLPQDPTALKCPVCTALQHLGKFTLPKANGVPRPGEVALRDRSTREKPAVTVRIVRAPRPRGPPSPSSSRQSIQDNS